MKKVKKILAMAAIAAVVASVLTIGCKKPEEEDGKPANLDGVHGSVSGVWNAGTTVTITDQVWVEHGKKLIVEEGVTILIKDGSANTSNAPIEFFVEGSLLLKGTASKPILVTVADAGKRTFANRYAGLWGGFVGGNDFQELLFNYVTVEFTGALCQPNSQSVIAGINEADKDRTAQILTNNPNGKIVVMNSTFRYAESDAMYFMGGQAIVMNNIIHTIGQTDNDGINMKAGVKVDIAYNLMFSVNSNGMKLSSSGQSPERPQALIRAYNNTIVNSGWRRVKNVKGGSIFLEKGALASVYNNLILNSKMMAKTPKWNNPSPSDGADHGSILDYNFYASGTQTMIGHPLLTVDGVTIESAYAGYTMTDSDYWHDGRNGTPALEQNSLIATGLGTPAISFRNFGFNSVPLYSDEYNSNWDFRVTSADSPVLVGANGKAPRNNFGGNYAPYFAGIGLTIDGVNYKSPYPKAQYGAFGN